MSLEDAINANTAAVTALTAAVQGKPIAGGAKAGAAATTKPAGAKKPKNSEKDVMEAAVKVKKAFDTAGAKFLIAKHGADELKALKPEVYDDFVADCEKAIEAGEIEGLEGDDTGL